MFNLYIKDESISHSDVVSGHNHVIVVEHGLYPVVTQIQLAQLIFMASKLVS
jgi:hypothetical protein